MFPDVHAFLRSEETILQTSSAKVTGSRAEDRAKLFDRDDGSCFQSPCLSDFTE